MSARGSSRARACAGSTWCGPTRWCRASGPTTPTAPRTFGRTTPCGPFPRLSSSARPAVTPRTRATENVGRSRPTPDVPSLERRGRGGSRAWVLTARQEFPLSLRERGTGGEDLEARRRELLTPKIPPRQGDRDGEGARHTLHQSLVRAPAVRAVAGRAGRGPTRHRGRGSADRGRWSDLVRPGQRSARGEILRVRAGRRHAAHHGARRPGAAPAH